MNDDVAFVTRHEAIGFGRILDSLFGRFGGVHAFGNNSTESEPIWMKSGALRVHCWGLALADFGRDPPSSDSWETGEILFLFLVR